MKSLSRVATLGILVMAWGISPVRADVSGPFTTTTPIASTLTDFTGNLVFAQFNSSLGTLTGVTLTITDDLLTTLSVTNNSGSASHGSARTEVTVTVTDPNPANTDFSVVNDFLSSKYSYSLAGGGSSTSTEISNPGNSQTNSFSDPITLADFTGTGTIALGLSTATQTDLSNTGGNTSASQVTYVDATGTVTYTYTPFPVPEPSTMVLLGVGGFLMCVSQFRRPRNH